MYHTHAYLFEVWAMARRTVFVVLDLLVSSAAAKFAAFTGERLCLSCPSLSYLDPVAF